MRPAHAGHFFTPAGSVVPIGNEEPEIPPVDDTIAINVSGTRVAPVGEHHSHVLAIDFPIAVEVGS